jgi:hypothetical protein
MQIAVVEWLDSACPPDGGWTGKGESVTSVLTCTSIGIVAYEDIAQITLIHSTSRSQHIEALSIPKCSIKRLRKLKIAIL